MNNLTLQSPDLCESTDDEQNSHGSNLSDDYVFDIVSQSTEESESEELCIKQNIIDCCSFSKEDFYLTTNYEIMSDHRKIACNRKLKKLFSYDGNLYGLDKYGSIYVLSTCYYSSDYWIFTQVEWLPKHIKHVSATLDGQHLWVQTDFKCYLFHNHKSTIVNTKAKRIYGKTKNNYLEIENNSCSVYSNGNKIKTIKDVKSAVLDCHHDIHIVKVNDSYNEVRILNHKPCYF